jgi:hypothetical protein
MNSARTILAGGAALAVLAVPATADAKPQHAAKLEHQGGHGATGKQHGGHKVSLLLRGTWSGGTLQVTGGNRAVRRAGLVGDSLTLDLTSAKLKVADRNGDGTRDAEDLRDGDKVVVQARLARGEAVDGTLTVRKLVAHAQDASGGSADDASGDATDVPAGNAPDTSGDA